MTGAETSRLASTALAINVLDVFHTESPFISIVRCPGSIVAICHRNLVVDDDGDDVISYSRSAANRLHATGAITDFTVAK